MRPSKKPRPIKAEQILIGDTIRVTHHYLDTTTTVLGKVAERDTDSAGTNWLTKERIVLLYRDNGMRVQNGSRTALARITLVDRPTDNTPTLPGMDI